MKFSPSPSANVESCPSFQGHSPHPMVSGCAAEIVPNKDHRQKPCLAKQPRVLHATVRAGGEVVAIVARIFHHHQHNHVTAMVIHHPHHQRNHSNAITTNRQLRKYYFSTIGQILVSVLRKLLDDLKTNSPKDHHNLLVLETENPTIVLFNGICRGHNDDWNTVPLLNEFTETMLHSRLAPMVVMRYIDAEG